MIRRLYHEQDFGTHEELCSCAWLCSRNAVDCSAGARGLREGVTDGGQSEPGHPVEMNGMTNCRGVLKSVLFAASAALALTASVLPVAGQSSSRQREDRLRRGVLLSVGLWNPQVRNPRGADVWASPLFELAYLDGSGPHLAVENLIGLFVRDIRARSATPLYGSGTRRIRSVIVPLMTGFKYYPFTTPQARLQPFIHGGLGFALDVERTWQQGGPLGSGTDGNTTVGLGASVDAGIDLLLRRVGVVLDGGYMFQWMGGQFDAGRSYPGVTAGLALTYRPG